MASENLAIPDDESLRMQKLRKIGRFIDEDLTTIHIEDQILDLVSDEIAIKYLVLPYQIIKNETKEKIVLISGQVRTSSLIDQIEQQIGLSVEMVFTTLDNVRAGIEKHYGVEIQRGRNVVNIENRQTENVEIEETALVKKVNRLLDVAVRRRTTDIVIRPEENESRVFIEVDGEKIDISDEFPIPLHEKDAIVRRIKIMCEPELESSTIMPQGGSFKFRGEKGDLSIDCRVSIMPSVDGECTVIRLLDSGKEALGIRDLGYGDTEIRMMQLAVRQPNGIFVVSGPTGSGKNTTLVALLKLFDPDKYNIMTVEDPVEYKLPGVVQVQIRRAKEEKNNLTFEKVLRDFLRQNPDIGMIGEIRDTVTAEIAIQASLTGHRILSTVHANDGISALPRLFELGVDKRLLLSQLSCIMSQRLLPFICPDCIEKYTPKEEELLFFSKNDRAKIMEAASKGMIQRGIGCKKCQGTGVFGRTAVGEFILFDPWLRDYLLRAEGFEDTLKTLRERYKFKTMREKGFELVLNGNVSIDKFEEIIQNTEWSLTEWM